MAERTWIKPGDRVRLTGHSWDALGMRNKTAVVVDIDLDGDPLIEDPRDGGALAIYKALPELDYSAERLES